MPFREIVDAGDDEGVGEFQILCARWPANH
jgi:hypothetical protein